MLNRPTLAFCPIASLLFGVTLLVAGCGDGKIGGMQGTDGNNSGANNGEQNDIGVTEARLTWEAPTTNADGTPLTDLVGYRVYVGAASRAYDAPRDVGLQTEYLVADLVSGTRYYYAVTAYDTSGNESELSAEVFKDAP